MFENTDLEQKKNTHTMEMVEMGEKKLGLTCS